MLDDEPYANEIKLKNRIMIACFPSTLASLRGWSIPVAVLDEVGYWRQEGSADADVEILSSVRRGMINFRNSRLVKISSPYMKSGILYDDFKNHFGQDSQDILVWRASSTFMNPELTDTRMESQRRLDPVRYQREYEAEFAEDLETFLPAVWIESAVVRGRYELAALDTVRYCAGVDVSGLASGPGADSFTLAIGHCAKDVFILDVCKGWKKSRNSNLNLDAIVGEIGVILKQYRIIEIHGDKYGAQWVVEAFRKASVMYRQLEEPKSFYYQALEPIFAVGKIEILDHPELIRELRMLERRPHQGGRITVDHPSGRHDDHSNALGIAVSKAKRAGAAHGYPIGVGRVVNPFSSSLPRGTTELTSTRGRYPAPLAVGNSGWSLHSRDDDDDYYVGAKPVR